MFEDFDLFHENIISIRIDVSPMSEDPLTSYIKNGSERCQLALTDRSYRTKHQRESKDNAMVQINFELGTLGDAVLRLALTQILYHEGREKLIEERARYESDRVLVERVAPYYRLRDVLRYDDTNKDKMHGYDYFEYSGDGDHPQKFLATAMEALLGAYFLDHGESVSEVIPIVRNWMSVIDKDYVCIDTERSTGGDDRSLPIEERKCSIIEIAAIKVVDGRPEEKYWDVQLIPGRCFDSYALDVLHRDPDRYAKGKDPETALAELIKFVGHLPVLGCDFVDKDLYYINEHLECFKHDKWKPDVIELQNRCGKTKLEYMCQRFSIRFIQTHSAIDDARVTVECFESLNSKGV